MKIYVCFVGVFPLLFVSVDRFYFLCGTLVVRLAAWLVLSVLGFCFGFLFHLCGCAECERWLAYH